MNSISFGWRHWFVALSACCATAVAAFLAPVSVPQAPAAVQKGPLAEILTEKVALAARGVPANSLASRRWSESRTPSRQSAKPVAADRNLKRAINPKLLKMNYVGLIVVQGQRTVLLKVPGVGIERYVAGDTLPDGQVLVSVTDRSLRLKAKGRPEEELMLFPTGRKRPPR